MPTPDQLEPWLAEPDALTWYDTATGLRCAIRRSQLGALCGYVRIPRRHPWFGRDYHRLTSRVLVHGGLTFSGYLWRRTGGLERGFWIGFDCAHAFDLVPIMSIELRRDCIYRTVDYVRQEVECLAADVYTYR